MEFAELNRVAMSYKTLILLFLCGFTVVGSSASSALAPEVSKERVEYIYSSPLDPKEEIRVDKSPTSAYERLPNELRRICSCESTGSPNKIPQQFDKAGNVIHGKINPMDIGMCQINTEPRNGHDVMSKELGFDLYTEEGNASYALWLYTEEGNGPWRYSSSCWGRGAGATGTTSVMKL